MDSTTDRVASAVRDAMAKQGVSRSALADATGIPRVTLIRRLNGQVPFDVAQLDLVAAHLGLTAAALIGTAA